jgi:iron(II)-dependent oxidoreductase
MTQIAKIPRVSNNFRPFKTEVGLALSALLVVMLSGCTSKPTVPAEMASVPKRELKEMVLVPMGEFKMGASETDIEPVSSFGWSPSWSGRIQSLLISAKPAHTVYLDDFFIDKFEVTNAQYSVFVKATGHRRSNYHNDSRFNAPDQPVVGVSWFDAKEFCSWAGKRLPTEAEWEKAARGTDGRIFPWGNRWDTRKLRSADSVSGQSLNSFNDWSAWQNTMFRTDFSKARPSRAGSFPAGASVYGAMDMAGNVWEWVADWYGTNYYSESPRRNPSGPTSGRHRVLRGGAWDVPKAVANTWFRENFIEPGVSESFVTGFRCAKNLLSIAADTQSFEKGVRAHQRGDLSAAMQEWLPLAEQGVAEAQLNIGIMYRKGLGVPQDYAKARQWLDKAADQGHDTAQMNMALLYREGLGVPQDYAVAADWYRKAALRGNVEGQYNLGWLYLTGTGVSRDLLQAYVWSSLPAQLYPPGRFRDDAISNRDAAYGAMSETQREEAEREAAFRLGWAYNVGQGTEANPNEAIKFYCRSAKLGLEAAGHTLLLLGDTDPALRRQVMMVAATGEDPLEWSTGVAASTSKNFGRLTGSPVSLASTAAKSCR